MTAAKARGVKKERHGPCLAVTSTMPGRCDCQQYAPGRVVGGFTTCAECRHSQGVHQKVEVA